jgi:ATP-dependent helicase/DNAse subunit B
MTARDYPRRASQNLLFPDSDLERLRSAGIPVRTAADEDRDEEMLFESLKTRASMALILTASARDTSGKTIVPSLHFAEVSQVEQASGCAPAARISAPEPGKAGLIGHASLAGLAEQHRKISLTALEDLAKCRFRFFSSRSLRLQGVPERPSDRIQARTRGSIFHKAMENWLTDQTRDFVGIFEQAFVAFCEEYNIPKGYSLEVERIESGRIARKINGSVRWPALQSETEIDCPLEFPDGVTVTCRVDRIDHLKDGTCRIIDYKSGKVANVVKLVESKTSLQGPLYALAARQKTQLNPVAMVFVAIREGKVVGWGDIADAGPDVDLRPMPPDWIDIARDRTIAQLRNFLAGHVHPEPVDPEDCKWCDFRNACRIEQQVAPEEIEIVKIGVAGAN